MIRASAETVKWYFMKIQYGINLNICQRISSKVYCGIAKVNPTELGEAYEKDKKNRSNCAGFMFNLLTAIFACTAGRNVNDADKTFAVTILDEEGKAVEGADLFLYSFLDEKVVASERTDSEGKAQMRYYPDLDDLEPSKFIHGDYIIYTVKDGYTSREYSMTKIYCSSDYCSEDEMEFSHKLNAEKHVIKLEKERTASGLKDAAAASKEDLAKQVIIDKVRKELIAEKKLTKEAPVHVLTEEDYRTFEEKGIATEAGLKSINADESQKSIQAATSSELNNKVTRLLKSTRQRQRKS